MSQHFSTEILEYNQPVRDGNSDINDHRDRLNTFLPLHIHCCRFLAYELTSQPTVAQPWAHLAKFIKYVCAINH